MESPYTPPNTPLEVKPPQREPGLPLRMIAIVCGLAGILSSISSYHLLGHFSELAKERGVACSLAGWFIPGALAGAAGIATLALSLLSKRSGRLALLAFASLLLAIAAILITPLAGYSVRTARIPPPTPQGTSD